MKAYGDRGFWQSEDYGVPTRIAELKSRTRTELRRKLHKQGRNDGKRDILRELKEYYD